MDFIVSDMSIGLGIEEAYGKLKHHLEANICYGGFVGDAFQIGKSSVNILFSDLQIVNCVRIVRRMSDTCSLGVKLLIKVGGKQVCILLLNLVYKILVMKKPLLLIFVVDKIREVQARLQF